MAGRSWRRDCLWEFGELDLSLKILPAILGSHSNSVELSSSNFLRSGGQESPGIPRSPGNMPVYPGSKASSWGHWTNGGLKEKDFPLEDMGQ